MKSSLSSAEVCAKTLEAFAHVIRALAPEAIGISFHDAAADTLWMSEDFLLPEDHQLVWQTLADEADGSATLRHGRIEGSRYAAAVAVRDSAGAVNGAVRLSIDAQVADARIAEPLALRLAPVLVCLAAEFERLDTLPGLPVEDAVHLAQIDGALDARRFELFVQPIRSLQVNPDAARYEVLLRLRTAQNDILEPASFLRSAGHRNLMPAIDRWVLRTLLVWLVANRDFWSRTPAIFCINLAAQSMTDDNFINFVESCVQKSGVPPRALCFEITERFASCGSISVSDSIRRLEALGCEVALDDFGANAPSYNYLRTIPAHYFKIDASLVTAAGSDRVAHAVISSIVRMANDLGVQTVAESVESNSELEAMRRLGCRLRPRLLLRQTAIDHRLRLQRKLLHAVRPPCIQYGL